MWGRWVLTLDRGPESGHWPKGLGGPPERLTAGTLVKYPGQGGRGMRCCNPKPQDGYSISDGAPRPACHLQGGELPQSFGQPTSHSLERGV